MCSHSHCGLGTKGYRKSLCMSLNTCQLTRDVLSVVIPLGRLGTADEAAAAYEFLLHPRNSYITGLVMNVDGGLGSVRVATPGNPEAPKSHE